MSVKTTKFVKIILLIAAVGIYAYVYFRKTAIENVVEGVLCILFFAVVILASKYIEKSKEVSLKNFVSGVFCMGTFKMIENVETACVQYDLKKCRFCGREKDFAEEILKAYENSLVYKYFRGELAVVGNITDTDYFFITLYAYLDKKQDRLSSFLYDVTKSEEDKEAFESAFYKMLYVSYLYCNRSKRINPKGNLYYNVKELEKEAFQKIARENA